LIPKTMQEIFLVRFVKALRFLDPVVGYGTKL
jgi:hypothetical protein